MSLIGLIGSKISSKLGRGVSSPFSLSNSLLRMVLEVLN
jgi:hypothetical protein